MLYITVPVIDIKLRVSIHLELFHRSFSVSPVDPTWSTVVTLVPNYPGNPADLGAVLVWEAEEIDKSFQDVDDWFIARKIHDIFMTRLIYNM